MPSCPDGQVLCTNRGDCGVDHRATALGYLRAARSLEPLVASSYSDSGTQAAMQGAMDRIGLQGQIDALAACVEYLLRKVPSPVEVEMAKTAEGGWTREQLAKWGVAWPPPNGWRRALEREHEAIRS